MAKIIIRGGIPDDTITTDFDNLPSSTLYKLGDYRIETNIDRRKIIDYTNKLNTFSKEYTLENLGITKTLSEKLYNPSFNINNDYSNISSYSNYGSLVDKLEYTVLNIIETYPYSLYVNNNINGIIYSTVLNIIYYPETNTSNFDIPCETIVNNGNLIVNSGNFSTNIKNFNINKNNYSIRLDENLEIEYDVINFTGDILTDTYLNFTVKGKPFTTSTASKIFHIKPNQNEYFSYINNLTNLEKFFLSNKKSNKYIINLKKPISDENGTINLTDIYLEWYFSDGYNIDINGLGYKKFVKNLLELGLLYDKYKTDTVYRMYITESLKLFDQTSNNKITILSRTYGETFDRVKQFIDGLSKINTIGYNKYKSVPDILVKNLANTLGWDYRDIVIEEDLLSNLFNYTQGDISESKIPSEINIELWRRILNNTVDLFKAKGTRNSIYTFFKMIGVPEEFINLNEYVYVINNPAIIKQININSESEIGILNRPTYDENGYPVTPIEYNNFYFQALGNTDFGQTYINRFRNDGFELERVSDNKKTWLYGELPQERNSSNTYYNLIDSRYVINTKEISVGLSVGNAEAYKIFTDSSGTTSFNQYLNEHLNTLIDVKNRKIISDNIGGMYPKLSKIYYDYALSNSNFKYINLLNFIKKFDKYFVNFITQLIPATVIYKGLGLLISNGGYIKQKHKYIRGIDDGSEFIGNTQFLTCDNFIITNVNVTNVTGNNLGSIQINVESGNQPYTYSIDDNIYQVSNIFNGLDAGTYNIYIKDSIGCKLINNIIIDINCNIIISNFDVKIKVPVITVTPLPPTPLVPPLPTPTPSLTPATVQTCPLGLVDTFWAGPYTSSIDACLLAPTDLALGNISVTLFINENAIEYNQINYGLVHTAWLNCDTIKHRPANYGYYSNGTGWIYVSNVVSSVGTNVSGSGTCELDNNVIV